MVNAIKTFFKEFRQFAVRGNVISMAVGVMVGGAFQSIISSLIEDIISPIIGLFVRQNFNFLELNFLGITIRYGSFITTVIHFFIMAFVVFILVRAMNHAEAYYEKNKNKNSEQNEEEERKCPYCFTIVHKEASKCQACTSSI